MSDSDNQFTPEMLDDVIRILHETEERKKLSRDYLKIMGNLGFLSPEDLCYARRLEEEISLTGETLSHLPIEVTGYSPDGRELSGKLMGILGFENNGDMMIGFAPLAMPNRLQGPSLGLAAPLSECVFQITEQ